MLEKRILPKDKSIPSLIKWTGSKRSQAKLIFNLRPKYKRYIEPFLGGGSMMYLFAHLGAIGNDLYKPLVDLWILVRDHPEELIIDYQKKWGILNQELDQTDFSFMTKGNKMPSTFYEIRRQFNLSPNPFDLNFLMRTCVNGIVRFNNNKEFNNSFHLSRRGMKPERFTLIVREWHRQITGVQFYCKDYKTVISETKPSDFVYLDPPYAGTKNRYISQLNPSELFDELEKLNAKNVNWALSYDGRSGADDLTYNVPKNLYKNFHYIDNGNSAVKKVLNGPIERVEEALYTNY